MPLKFGNKGYSLVQTDQESATIRQRVQKNLTKASSITTALGATTTTGGGKANTEFDALYKIVLIGESNTGKTSLLLRFSENIFSENYLCTIGVDFKTRTLKVDGQ